MNIILIYLLSEKQFLTSRNFYTILFWNGLILLKGNSERDEYREFQYLVMDYLAAMQKFLTYDDVPHIKRYIKSKQWWDTIDGFDRIVGNIAFVDDRINDLMLDLVENLIVVKINMDVQGMGVIAMGDSCSHNCSQCGSGCGERTALQS